MVAGPYNVHNINTPALPALPTNLELKFICSTALHIIEQLKYLIVGAVETKNRLPTNQQKVTVVINPKLSVHKKVQISDQIPAVKYLGVFCDPQLNFKYNIQQISNKLSRTLNIP
jgi:hypothetical protein